MENREILEPKYVRVMEVDDGTLKPGVLHRKEQTQWGGYSCHFVTK
jgi:hypothetical protein